MTLNLDESGLESIINDFDLLFIDIWGVLHNGINLFNDSVYALDQIERLNKEYVLLTNAPRPNSTVIKFLKKMGLDQSKCDKVFTSGQAALKYLNSDFKKLKFYHIGPPRDFDLFKLFEEYKVDTIEDCDFLLCTGLFEDFEKDLKFYENLFKNKVDKNCLLYTSPSPRDLSTSRMPSSA